MLGVDPLAHRSTDHLLKSVGISRTVRSRLLEGSDDGGAHLLENGVIGRETSSVNFRADDNGPGLRVDGDKVR